MKICLDVIRTAVGMVRFFPSFIVIWSAAVFYSSAGCRSLGRMTNICPLLDQSEGLHPA
jgi:hypothetical protein